MLKNHFKGRGFDMFFQTFDGWVMEGSRTVSQKCTHCGNTSDHFVYVAPKGPQMGLIFRKKPLLGAKSYFLVCSICRYSVRELTKAQAEAMKE